MTSTQPNPSIVMTSPPNKVGVSSHPRRTPAKRSVSLLHSKPQPSRLKKQSTASSSEDGLNKNDSGESGATDSPSSLLAVGGRNSSGESSNADRWFEKSNNEVRENSAPFADNDPPFFMRNSSSSETPPDLRQQITSMNIEEGTNSLPLRTGLLQLGTDGSSTEDFRSVIDDLTVENKKLKRRLKKYEKLHDAHLKDEKLFEVRIHGLPAEKKRELEDTLRKFASSLIPSGANAFPPDGYASLMPMLKGTKTASSQASVHNADSAYASMSASGQGSTAQSGNDSHRLTPSQYPAVRQQNIHNYLHDIPEGLLPRQNPAVMTERAKKKLVVRRMEQIFAGKGATAGGHQQSIQQQEVSQSAAKTDRTAKEAAGQRARQEGTREAAIMEGETEDPLDGAQRETPWLEERTVELQPKEKNGGHQDFAEQRPTRPLDLDPQRAQVPAENIRYLQQMGFSPLNAESSRSLEDGRGWIYLNFLINMAQLHTINVTSDFVRKAISEYSHKFEVSDDGRRVRWKGGANVTRTSSSGEDPSPTGGNTPDRQSPRKRLKLSHHFPTRHVEGGTSQRLQSETSKFSYTPLFSHRDDSEETDDSSSEEEESGDTSSPYPRQVHGDSSGMTSSEVRTASVLPSAPMKKKHKHDDGPIIFYNNARFCTDLSGDLKTPTNYSTPLYTTASDFPIGGQRRRSDDVAEKRGPLAETSELPEPMDLSDNPIPDHMELSFPERSPPRPSSSGKQKPIDLEVTGIGGVWPADNFTISVESRQAKVDHSEEPAISSNTRSKRIPERLAQVLSGPGSKMVSPPTVQKHVISSKLQILPPSELPPALNFMPFGEESDDGEDSDIEAESDVPEDPGAMPPSAAPQPVCIPSDSSDEESEEDNSDEEESDGEVDFLAGVRQLDPEAVWRKEREYDANMADRLAEEIPAGSSAATAGGGSGFASPADGTSRRDYQRAVRQARKNSEISKPSAASDSMVANNSDESDSGDES